ncbi:class I SAM-dependent methyltransferase [Chloroflexus aggregans]|jgi:ubiquinone/menaquinone biosynthesis C-methylase UbiE|uniref:Methyltransferase type 11 n=1 Tax=Chloroflexus aggregans (strain MD-66 / DSM 9485) TaxID=326427 RepID=B8GBH1_CHLAD|nr:class I SAM-dependent methyltransferase [Chloroflexus aggregans]ACL24799.1 Methyltransferase type 11 [Chloroflexus aggregans DSM 9485]
MNLYDPFARYYDADFRHFHDDIPFYREWARRTGDPILELMCGTGRVLLPLAAAGYRLTGVDLSPAMLAIARERLAAEGLTDQVTLIEADVRQMVLPENHFTLAFVAVNSFMHLTTIEDQLATLAAVRRTLTRKGILIIDLFNPDPLTITREDGRLQLERSYELDGCRVQKFVVIESDPAEQISHVTFIYDETAGDGVVTRRTMQFTMRWLYRFELEHLLARAGFTLRAVYGSYDLEPYTTASPRLIAVAAPRR